MCVYGENTWARMSTNLEIRCDFMNNFVDHVHRLKFSAWERDKYRLYDLFFYILNNMLIVKHSPLHNYNLTETYYTNL